MTLPQVTGPLTTTAPSDVFGTHDSFYGIGGLREVANKAARNAIPDERRRAGMLVYTADDGIYWTLLPDADGDWSGTDSDWQALELGAGETIDVLEFSFPNPVMEWVMDHDLGNRPTVITVDLNNEEFFADVSYPTPTQVRVRFDKPGGVAGYATLKRS